MGTASRPETPTQDLWASILDSVSSSRSTPSKQILLLGEPQTGKSTLVSALLQQPLDKTQTQNDFALGFDWADVRDDADEDTLARLSVFTVPSSSPVHLALVPQVLPALTALPNSLVMIVLDWTTPWLFIEQLELWLVWLEKWTKGDGSREMEVIRDENRERMHYHLQHYSEHTDEPLPVTTAALASTALPLPSGSFTNNPSGIPIAVVCTKADLIDDANDIVGVGTGGMGGMVKGKGGEWEEQTDGIMQVLRTICLKYGAALFYTTQQPSTTAVLRQYALHSLFTPPPPQPSFGSTEAPVPVRNPFPFVHPANALDRDRIVIPAGWDSWGKIGILRDGFEASKWSDAWEHDIEALPSYPFPLPFPSVMHGARSQFAVLVGGDRGLPPQNLPAIIQPTPEQVFLQQHYESLSKDPTRDPRITFRQPVAADGTSAPPASGVVGPLGSVSFSLPSVEKALGDMESGDTPPPPERGSERTRPHPVNTSANPTRREPRPPALTTPTGPTSAKLPSPNLGPGGKSQHEVLHNFFQSLLTSRTGGGSAAPANSNAAPNANSGSATLSNSTSKPAPSTDNAS